MKNFKGMKQGELTKAEQTSLLKTANCLNGVTGNNIDDGECIVDLTEDLSIVGVIIKDEIIIDNESVIYNPGE